MKSDLLSSFPRPFGNFQNNKIYVRARKRMDDLREMVESELRGDNDFFEDSDRQMEEAWDREEEHNNAIADMEKAQGLD